MDWIFDHFQIVVLIALAVGSVIRQIAETAKTKRQERKLLERRREQQDTTWEPVPVPPRYQAPPPLPPSIPQAPLLAENNDEVLRRQMEMQEKLREIRDGKAKAREAAPSSAQARRMPGGAPTGIRAALRNPASTRQAIVLREILGTPVGLRH